MLMMDMEKIWPWCKLSGSWPVVYSVQDHNWTRFSSARWLFQGSPVQDHPGLLQKEQQPRGEQLEDQQGSWQGLVQQERRKATSSQKPPQQTWVLQFSTIESDEKSCRAAKLPRVLMGRVGPLQVISHLHTQYYWANSLLSHLNPTVKSNQPVSFAPKLQSKVPIKANVVKQSFSKSCGIGESVRKRTVVQVNDSSQVPQLKYANPIYSNFKYTKPIYSNLAFSR